MGGGYPNVKDITLGCQLVNEGGEGGQLKIPVNVVYEWPLKVFILYLKRQCNRFPISSHWVNSSANRLDVHYIGRPM